MKAFETDERLLRDDVARPVDRAAALGRLVYDGRRELEPLIANLLQHEDGLLRGEAIHALVGRWRIAAHVPSAIRLMHHDPDWVSRMSAVQALSNYVTLSKLSPPEMPQIFESLHRAQEDADFRVSDAARDALSRINQQ